MREQSFSLEQLGRILVSNKRILFRITLYRLFLVCDNFTKKRGDYL